MWKRKAQKWETGQTIGFYIQNSISIW
jgi:hypothetical protein